MITVSPVNDELLSDIGKLTAEYGRMDGNLNQMVCNGYVVGRILRACLFSGMKYKNDVTFS